MAETNNSCNAGSNCFKEAVCIDAGRIYDSCSDKDCLEDMQVYFTDSAQRIIDQSMSIKCRNVEILNVYLDVEAVPFNKGFYSVDVTFFFLVDLIAYTGPMNQCVPVKGVATFAKKVILYGSEGSVKTFSSAEPRECPTRRSTNLPTASIQVVDPIVLSCRLTDFRGQTDGIPTFPPSICEEFDGSFCCCTPSKMVLITLGLFTIVQLERRVQMMIPAYDFCVPDKESVCTTDDPREMFKRIKFPTNDFFPPRLSELEKDC